MGDVPKRLAGCIFVPNTATLLYTAPAATTTILRAIHINNNSTTTRADFTLSIGTMSTGTQLFTAVGVGPSCAFDWMGFLPLATTETLNIISSNNNLLTVTICGVEVS